MFYRGLYAQRIAYIEPIGTFAFDISLNVVLMAVIGGPGTWQGPLIGAPLVLLVAGALRVTFTSEVNRVIFSLVVILIALFIPGGIMGWLARWRRWAQPGRAARHHIAAEDADLGHAKQDIDLPVPHPFQLFALRSAPQRRPATFRTDDLARLSPTTPLWKRRILRGDSKD